MINDYNTKIRNIGKFMKKIPTVLCKIVSISGKTVGLWEETVGDFLSIIIDIAKSKND